MHFVWMNSKWSNMQFAKVEGQKKGTRQKKSVYSTVGCLIFLHACIISEFLSCCSNTDVFLQGIITKSYSF